MQSGLKTQGKPKLSKTSMSCRIQGKSVWTSVCLSIRLTIHPESFDGCLAGRGERTDGRTDERTHRFPLYSTGHRPFCVKIHLLSILLISAFFQQTEQIHGQTNKQRLTCTDVELHLKIIGTCLLYINQHLNAHPFSGLPGFCHTFGVMVSVLLTKSVKASLLL